MKTKYLFLALGLVAATSASANGGLSNYNVEKHMNSDRWVKTENVDKVELTVQGPLDGFKRYVAKEREMVDTEFLKQNYDGQS